MERDATFEGFVAACAVDIDMNLREVTKLCDVLAQSGPKMHLHLLLKAMANLFISIVERRDIYTSLHNYYEQLISVKDKFYDDVGDLMFYKFGRSLIAMIDRNLLVPPDPVKVEPTDTTTSHVGEIRAIEESPRAAVVAPPKPVEVLPVSGRSSAASSMMTGTPSRKRPPPSSGGITQGTSMDEMPKWLIENEETMCQDDCDESCVETSDGQQLIDHGEPGCSSVLVTSPTKHRKKKISGTPRKKRTYDVTVITEVAGLAHSLPHAIYLGLMYSHDQSQSTQFRSFRRNISHRTSRTARFLQECGITKTEDYTLEDVAQFQRALPEYQLIVFDESAVDNRPLFAGPYKGASKMIGLRLSNTNHFDHIKIIAKFLGVGNWCGNCHESYRTISEHRCCIEPCERCLCPDRAVCLQFTSPPISRRCAQCAHFFQTQACWDHHFKANVDGRTPCEIASQCPRCHMLFEGKTSRYHYCKYWM